MIFDDMCAMRDFSDSLDPSYRNASLIKSMTMVKPETINYPRIVVQLRGNRNPEPLFLSSNSGPMVLQKIINKFTKEGFWCASEELIKVLEKNSYYMSVLMYPLKFLMKFSPQAKLKGFEVSALSDISKIKLWFSSVLRCMAWNLITHKLAVVSSDDIIFVYNRKGGEAIMEKKSQRVILSLAWRPFSSDTLAVGCEKGIFIWTVEFSNLHIKPIVNNVCRFIRNDHRYVTGLSWNKMGDLLASTAVTSKVIYIWNYSLKDCIPLRRINSHRLNFVLWSPDNSNVFECSTNETFRIWSTDKWSSDNWSVNNKSRVQCACWSPCSSILLFGTDSCSVINAIYFQNSVVFTESNEKKVAWPIIDLNNVYINDNVIGGTPSDMCWDKNGKHLAITLKNDRALIVFQTALNVSSVDCVLLCVIQGRLDEEPSTIAFQPTYKDGSLLTIGWSNGKIEYVPFSYCEKPQNQTGTTSFFQINKTTSGQFSMITSNSFIDYLSK